ncbi:unnamed protein product [Brachionus calyciflorus]|uniref:Poly [ADP-ribose] polymerase n=1 Tax=Brachionus calyciflorus TaxID=104777 RepID=A0A814AW35_9BILA|nr:unnamed protein product [Brachionus calyciflorus]
MSDKPDFACEYAKSDRSGCKLCKSNIGMSTLRMAIYVQSPFFDGKMPMWYHFNCFWKKAKVKPLDTSFIKGFDSIRWEDQQKIKNKLGLGSEENDENMESDSNDVKIDQFLVEYSKSNRSKCKKCSSRIDKDIVRVGIKGHKSGDDGFYHIECFVEQKNELGFTFKIEEVEGFVKLNENDQENITKLIKPHDHKRKFKEEPSEESDLNVKKAKNEEDGKEKQLKLQSEKFWSLRDSLNKEVANDLIKELILQNDQKIQITGRDDLLMFLTDMMLFGPLEPCPECKNGQLVFRGTAYYCTGNITEWTNCSYRTQEPIRKTYFDFDPELKKEFTAFKNFKFQPSKRLFAKTLGQLDEDKENNLKKLDSKEDSKENLKLYNISFSAIGKLSKKNADIKLIIERYGGRFTSNLSEFTVCVISNEQEIEKMNKKLRDCESNGIVVLSENFLKDLQNLKIKKEAIDLFKENMISSWTVDLENKIEICRKFYDKKLTEEKVEKYSAIKSIGDGSGRIKMKIKGGAVVDPETNLEDEGHVLLEHGSKDPYSVVLGLVDISRGTNSYYKMQIIEDDKKDKYYLFRAWGRVGTTIGGNKLENYSKKHDVINDFCALYLDKTGNTWDSRKYATKQPNKFYPLEMDYGNDDEDSAMSKLNDENYNSISKLAKPIQNLIKLIFNIETMKQQMKEFEIDLNKMPLGKISSNQIKQAFNILNELNELMDRKSNETLILDASNRFYTLIPHDFGMKKPPLLNDPSLIKNKTEMLNNLLDLEIAYNILKTDSNSTEDPIDMHYNKLKCHMEVLDHECEEFTRLVKYVQNTHAATHSSFKLIVEDIFKVVRDGEESKYESYKNLHNKKLLWHGSRLTNYAGILSQGLRIAPPEAPCTGYMFGKGVYFADMVSKSANYCFTTSSNPTGLLLLCEVALGDMYERTQAEFVTNLPKGKHSTKGCGRTAPSPEQSHFTPDGVEIPMGNGVDSGVKNSSLLYNEYIVYDVNQIKMKYLLRTKFEYNF